MPNSPAPRKKDPANEGLATEVAGITSSGTNSMRRSRY